MVRRVDPVTPLPHDHVLSLTEARFSGRPPHEPYRGIRSDDRAESGDLFVAIRGESYDSHRSLVGLAASGVRGAVGECPPPEGFALPYYRVENSRRALGLLEQALHGSPSEELRVFGVTGTNGKSTTVRILASLLESTGSAVGWMGTVTSCLGAEEFSSRMTTEEPSVLARSLARFRQRGGEELVMEVSSHALEQDRVAGIRFAGAILTNIGRDHLDYHGDPASYLHAKLKLFAALSPDGVAVVPHDGPVGSDDPRLKGKRTLTFGESPSADAFPEEIHSGAAGLQGRLRVLGERVVLRSPLTGRHNVLNLLAAALLARSLGVDRDRVAAGLSAAPPVPGRLAEIHGGPGRIFVDYAHTPDALAVVLTSLRELTDGRLIVVFGCGGDRDRGKRPEMGRIAGELADLAIITSDNPRTEDPQRIIDEIRCGLSPGSSFLVEADRGRAVQIALEQLTEGDLLVVAGKGHERQQIVSGETIPFDDGEVIRGWLAERGAP